MTPLARVCAVVAGIVTAGFLAALALEPARVLEGCRMLNVALGFGVAAGFFVRINDTWARYGIGGRIVRAGILMLMCVAAAGSAEAYVTHAELGYRAALLTISLLTCGVGLLLIRSDPDHD